MSTDEFYKLSAYDHIPPTQVELHFATSIRQHTNRYNNILANEATIFPSPNCYLQPRKQLFMAVAAEQLESDVLVHDDEYYNVANRRISYLATSHRAASEECDAVGSVRGGSALPSIAPVSRLNSPSSQSLENAADTSHKSLPSYHNEGGAGADDSDNVCAPTSARCCVCSNKLSAEGKRISIRQKRGSCAAVQDSESSNPPLRTPTVDEDATNANKVTTVEAAKRRDYCYSCECSNRKNSGRTTDSEENRQQDSHGNAGAAYTQDGPTENRKNGFNNAPALSPAASPSLMFASPCAASSPPPAMTTAPRAHYNIIKSPSTVESHPYICANIFDAQSFDNCPHTIVACQAPVPSQFEGFWQTVYQYEVPLIIMLTREVEHGVKKADCYWPTTLGDIVTFPNTCISVEMIDEIEINELEIVDRFFRVWIETTCGVEEHFCRQLQYLGWPDFGVPSERRAVDFLVAECEAVDANAGPIYIHCSAGVGRTGTLMGIYYARHYLRVNANGDGGSGNENVALLRETPLSSINNGTSIQNKANTNEYLFTSGGAGSVGRQQHQIISESDEFASLRNYFASPVANSKGQLGAFIGNTANFTPTTTTTSMSNVSKSAVLSSSTSAYTYTYNFDTAAAPRKEKDDTNKAEGGSFDINSKEGTKQILLSGLGISAMTKPSNPPQPVNSSSIKPSATAAFRSLNYNGLCVLKARKDVLDIVRKMKLIRTGMIQRPEQLSFVFKCLGLDGSNGGSSNNNNKGCGGSAPPPTAASHLSTTITSSTPPSAPPTTHQKKELPHHENHTLVSAQQHGTTMRCSGSTSPEPASVVPAATDELKLFIPDPLYGTGAACAAIDDTLHPASDTSAVSLRSPQPHQAKQ